MLKEFLMLFIIGIVFVIDCGFIIESDDPEQNCKTLVEDKIDDLVDAFKYSEKNKKEVSKTSFNSN